MQYLTIIRSSCLMLLGITVYSILLWILGRRIPGRLRRYKREADNKYDKHKVFIIFGFHFILAILILTGFIYIKYMVRGEL